MRKSWRHLRPILELTSHYLNIFCMLQFKVVRDPCQKITLLLLKSKSVRVIVPDLVFKREYLFSKTVDIILPWQLFDAWNVIM